ncbi:MAG: glycosyltransferase family 2 protein [Chitinophagaceae bacterium]|nr:MAG: glycosyltransferase family 2 protein [Chitinophagaceae bacterium]
MRKKIPPYSSLAYRLSRNIESSAVWLKLYKWFCFAFLKPGNVNQTPIFINNRNHYTYLKDLIDWLDKNGFTNYYVIDNDSTYPPLLEFYQAKLPERVIYLNKNAGHLSFWKENIIARVKNSFYIYTDSDVLPVLESNPSFLSSLYKTLKSHPQTLKVGPAIKIDDLPDYYALKKDVINHEEQFWNDPIAENLYKAPIDTTMALYLPNYYWIHPLWDNIRVSGDCLVRHQPWYQHSEQLTDEQKYYQSMAVTQTHWTVLHNEQESA